MFDFKMFIFIHKATILRTLKHLFICFIIIHAVWSFCIKKIVYQHFFATPHQEELVISDDELYIDLAPNSIRKMTVAGHPIKFKLLKQYQATGRVIYVDRYTNPIGKHFRNSDQSDASLIYDEVAPQDITFVVGDLAKFPKLKGAHEYRIGKLDYEDEETYKIARRHPHLLDTHMTNIHTIAATSNIQRGLDILKAGDLATLEGYLIYWEATLPSGYIMEYKSAVFAGEKHTKLKFGGVSGLGLCKQLLLTKITFDGYTFE